MQVQTLVGLVEPLKSLLQKLIDVGFACSAKAIAFAEQAVLCILHCNRGSSFM